VDFFKRHLNFTLCVLWIVGALLSLMAAVFASTNLAFLVYYSFGFLLLVVTTWYLRQKSRSELWIVAWFPWFIAAGLALKGITPPFWADILQVAPLFLVGLGDRTWRPIVS
jgi:hypothetical protein